MGARVPTEGPRDRIALVLPVFGVGPPDRSQREGSPRAVVIEVEAVSGFLIGRYILEGLLVEAAPQDAVQEIGREGLRCGRCPSRSACTTSIPND